MDFTRRLKLFLFGVVLGSFIMYFMVFKDRDIYKSPQQVIMEGLHKNKLELTKHGACRMKCRNITELEAKQLLAEGDVNYSKSKVHDKPCPSYAIEGKTHDGQNVRIVYAKCDSITRVVTAIDLDVETENCNCN
jgi:hypothetical protein